MPHFDEERHRVGTNLVRIGQPNREDVLAAGDDEQERSAAGADVDFVRVARGKAIDRERRARLRPAEHLDEVACADPGWNLHRVDLDRGIALRVGEALLREVEADDVGRTGCRLPVTADIVEDGITAESEPGRR